MKNGIICFGLCILIICGGLSVAYLISSKDVPISSAVEEDNLVKDLNVEKINAFFYEERKFLQAAFPYSLKEKDTIEDYSDFESKKRLVDAYYSKSDFDFSTLEMVSPDVVPTEYIISFQNFKNIYEDIFDEEIALNDIPSNYHVHDNYVSCFLPTGFGAILSVYWKTEYDQENDLYKLYYVDFATNYGFAFDELTDKYGYTKRTILDVNDLAKYQPSLTTITYQKKENHYYLVKTEYVTHPSF